MPAEVEIVTTRPELALLEPDWRALAERRGNAFVTPEWFFGWLDRLQSGAKPFVVVVRRPDRALVGLLPLVASVRAFRTLEFAGRDFADLVHPVAAEADDANVAAAAAPVLFRENAARTLLRLDNVGAHANWLPSLVKTGSPPLAAWEDHREVLPYIDLSGSTWEEFLATRSANFRSQLRRASRALERLPGVRFRRTVDSAELEADLAAFFELHDKRWRALERASALADPRARAALAGFARGAFRAGWLRLWFLEVEGRPVAAWYGWRLGERYAYYQSGLDPAHSALSGGFLLLAHTVRAAFEEGAAVYDLLAGAEAFKLRFATGQREVKTIVVSRSARPGHFYAAAGVMTRRLARRFPQHTRERVRLLLREVRR